jgi:hypothetical protein
VSLRPPRAAATARHRRRRAHDSPPPSSPAADCTPTNPSPPERPGLGGGGGLSNVRLCGWLRDQGSPGRPRTVPVLPLHHALDHLVGDRRDRLA